MTKKNRKINEQNEAYEIHVYRQGRKQTKPCLLGSGTWRRFINAPGNSSNSFWTASKDLIWNYYITVNLHRTSQLKKCKGKWEMWKEKQSFPRISTAEEK